MNTEKVSFGARPVLFERVALMGGSFDPPGRHHQAIVKRLAREDFDRVIVWPVGPYAGPTVSKVQIASNTDRRNMAEIAFGNLPKVDLFLEDLSRGGFTSNYSMQMRLAAEPLSDLRDQMFIPLAMPIRVREIWHVIGADNVPHIVPEWNDGEEMWEKARFLILTRNGDLPSRLPTQHRVLHVNIPGSASAVRECLGKGDAWEHLVSPEIAEYIKNNKVYG